MMSWITESKMRLRIALMVVCLSAFFIIRSIAGQYQWYYNDEVQNWFQQKDVYSFTTTHGGEFTGAITATAVDSLVYRTEPDHLNVLYFKFGTTPQAKQTVIDQIENNPQFRAAYPVVTNDSTIHYTEGLWKLMDNQLFIVFRNGNITSAELLQFLDNYALELRYAPGNGLPSGGNYAYIFEADDSMMQTMNLNTATLAEMIYDQDSALVKSASPNLLDVFQPATGTFNPAIAETHEPPTEEFEYEVVYQFSKSLHFTLDSEDKQTLAIGIFDLNGREQYFALLPPGAKAHSIDVSEFQKGMYFLNVAHAEGKLLFNYKFWKYD